MRKERKSIESGNCNLKRGFKRLLLIPSSGTSPPTDHILTDLAKLKKMDLMVPNHKYRTWPFVNGTKAAVEIIRKKEKHTRLFFITGKTKRGPNTLTLGRASNFQVLDKVDMRVESFRSIASFRSNTHYQLDNEPCLVFAGIDFKINPKYQVVRSLLEDTFRATSRNRTNLNDLERVISVVACEEKIYFRQYSIIIKCSSKVAPQVELSECGPYFELAVEQFLSASEKPKSKTLLNSEHEATLKNVNYNQSTGEFPLLHMSKQEIAKIALSKMKGSKRKSHLT